MNKKSVKVFPYFSFYMCLIFLVNISIVLSFFHGTLRACEIFRCVKIYWMFFLVLITALYLLSKKSNISLFKYIILNYIMKTQNDFDFLLGNSSTVIFVRYWLTFLNEAGSFHNILFSFCGVFYKLLNYFFYAYNLLKRGIALFC